MACQRCLTAVNDVDVNSQLSMWHITRARTDLGSDSRPHPVHCRSTWCQSVLQQSNSTGD